MPLLLQAGLQSPNPKMTPSPLSVSSTTSSPTAKDKQQKDSAVVLQLAKTKMCAFFERGKCASDTCRYAHSPSELRRPPNLQKTKLCKAFLQGKCRDGENCSFAHGESDLRVTAGIYKTQMCNFYERGYCKKGDRCNHAHGDLDLRPTWSPQKTPVREKGPAGVLETPDARTPPKVAPQGDAQQSPKKERLPLAELLTPEDSQVDMGPSVADLAALAFAPPPVPLSWTSYQLSPSTYAGEPMTPVVPRMLDPVDMLVDSDRRELMGLTPPMPWPLAAPPGLAEVDLEPRHLFAEPSTPGPLPGPAVRVGGAGESDALSQSLANLDTMLQGFAADVATLISRRPS
ncbi:unnamed protein product [Durusdinium trenchii]|uniref:Uncharacterized protein n=2 Tax=Durusdinium trenchii TaxID=1381693 RepID=A0ABP0HWM4_9DINO